MVPSRKGPFRAGIFDRSRDDEGLKTMKELLQERIDQLTEEYRSGEKMLADLDQRRAGLQATSSGATGP
jgi:hypothetical protein